MTRILIVDDDSTLVDFLKLLLESEGYETMEAFDGKMAADVIASQHPEVVLLDYMMPNMDGLDVLRYVSANYNTSFVVMLTGKGSEEVAIECMKAGAADYVVKPFDNDHLLGVIRNVIRLRDTELQKRKIDSQMQEMNRRLQQQIEELEAQMKELANKQAECMRLLNEGGENTLEKIRKILE